MSRRISVTSGVLTILAALFALLLVAVTPALAHHKDGHEGSKQSEESTEENPSDESADSSESSESSESSSESSESSETSESSGGSSSGSGFGHPYDPDPEPVSSDQSTTGPAECSDYGNESGGPYDHDSCDGTQGLHGGGGNGKCAGCTGQADDKSPGGQYPGDHNNGYECDHNNGVGKGNPAHSKCPPPPVTTTCPPGSAACPNPPPPPCDKDNDMSNGIQPCVIVSPVCDADNDMANGIQPCVPDVVLGRRDFSNPRINPPPDVVLPRPPGSVLPFTGMSVAGLMYLGLAMMVAGGVLSRARRSH